MITTVFIDVDDTLLDFEKCAKDSMEKALTDIHIPFEDAMFDVFTSINNDLWSKIEKGKITKDELYNDRWNLIFEKLNIRYDGRLFEKSFLKYLRNSSIPVCCAENLLKYLYLRYTVCIASNAPYNQQISRLRKANMLQYIHYFFISEKIGYSKPSTGFFDACFSELGAVTPNEVIIIGDSVTADIEGGISYGMKTCWFNHRGCSSDNVNADYIVNSLDEIIHIL